MQKKGGKKNIGGTGFEGEKQGGRKDRNHHKKQASKEGKKERKKTKNAFNGKNRETPSWRVTGKEASFDSRG